MKLTLAAGLALLSGAMADIAILYPYSGATWYANNTVALNWTAAATDATEFAVQLQNKDTSLLSSRQQLADQVYTANDFVNLLLPNLGFGDGYILTLTNRTNTSQIFATSQSFKIEAGTPSTTTNLANVASASATAQFIPNAGTNAATTTSASPFASTTAAAKSAAGRTAPAAAAVAVVGAALALAL